jgi:hypothetical protein
MGYFDERYGSKDLKAEKMANEPVRLSGIFPEVFRQMSEKNVGCNVNKGFRCNYSYNLEFLDEEDLD